MKILAKTIEGKEFIYNVKSAHAVSQRSAKRIEEFLNSCAWKCKPGEIWHIYEIDQYCSAYDIAQFQSFKIKNGNLYHNTVYAIWME